MQAVIRYLDASKIADWWQDFKTRVKEWDLKSQNCSTVVWQALEAGGARTKLNARQNEEIDDVLI